MNADQIIAHLKLEPHPEGGWFRQTWAADTPGRPSGTCIYFLLKAGVSSAWHRVDAGEVWHYYSGSPLILRRAATLDGPAYDSVLGPDLAAGQFPQFLVEQGTGKLPIAPENIHLWVVPSAQDLSSQGLS